MEKFAKGVVKHRKIIIIVYLVLMVPAVIGMINTRINYDMLAYLPKNLDTVKGQDIMLDNFGKGAFSYMMIEGKTPAECAEIQNKIEAVDHVDSVLWYNTLLNTDVPMTILPNKYYEAFNKDGGTLMAVFFDSSTSADETIKAIGDIRSLSDNDVYITGMSALVKDLKDLCEKEEPVYVGIAVLCAVAAMIAFLDSWAIPFIFLASIGMAIIYNLGTNFFLGDISYITKALAAVLQLAVTMDYSIFLWHSFEEENDRTHDKETAMEDAIKNTLTAVIGSSVTTIAGFIALCFMSYTLGADLGIVMAKGVLLGVIGSVTTLPAMLLIFDGIVEKTRHRSLIGDVHKMSHFIVHKSWIFVIIFFVVLFPAVYGYNNTNIYYDMSSALPKNINFVVSNEKVMKDFNIGTTHMVLVDKDMSKTDAQNMINEMEDVKGVKNVIGLDGILGNQIPEEMLPDKIVKDFKSGDYQMMIINTESKYRVASKYVNQQLTSLNQIVKKYDSKGTVIGEAACTKDLMKTTNRDFAIVSWISIAMIFVIIMLVLKSLSLPFILELTIYFAIFINLGLPYYTNTWLPFIAPICLSTIQLGSTVDYAILMTTRYKRERIEGGGKNDSIVTAVETSIPSIVTSAVGFFAATFGVSLYSDIDIISSMCTLMARGALISMLAVIFILPAFLRILDPIIIRTTGGLRQVYGKHRKEEVKAA